LTCTPRSWISFTCRQIFSRVAASMASPVLPPRRTSPLSLRMMLLYLTRGSAGEEACMTQRKRQGKYRVNSRDGAERCAASGQTHGGDLLRAQAEGDLPALQAQFGQGVALAIG